MFRLPVREVLSVGLALALAAAVPSRSPAFAQVPESLLTVAEKSRFQATSRHAEVVALCDNLAKAYPRVITRGELGQSGEGRTLPLLFLANPPVTTPQAAHASGKLVVFLFGNIHAGEVDGKEALPILAREVASVPDHPLLRDLILAIAPIYNADGNERVSKDNRPGQVGPAEGMGVRTNAQGLDLNRDAMKLEAPETRALVKFLNEWDPHMVVDTHTTNGSYHRYAMTYEGAKNPAGDRRLITFTRQKMFPDLTRALEQRSGAKSYFYGNFEGDHTRWTSFPSSPRFGTTYVGLRNRLSILTEAYSYISYEARVKVTHDFVLEALLFLAGHKDEVKYELDRARKSTVVAGEDPRPTDRVAIRSEARAFPGKTTVLGFVEVGEGRRKTSTGEPRDYLCAIEQDFVPTLEVPRPFAYLVPPTLAKAVEILKGHGIAVETLREPRALEVEVDRVTKLTVASRPFEGHRTLDVATTPRIETRTIPAGTWIIRTGQPLGSLAVYLLDPRSDDGLATWNVLDDVLKLDADAPIVRVMKRVERLGE